MAQKVITTFIVTALFMYALLGTLDSYRLLGNRGTGRVEQVDIKPERIKLPMGEFVAHRIVVFDGCEYVLFLGSNTELRYDGITHKGNCKNH